MADNLGYTEGTGSEVATDEIAGIHYQKVKLIHGVDGVAHNTSNNNPLPIEAHGELMEAIEAMRMAIVSLSRSIGLAQVNPLTGRMLVDGAGVTQPISGTISANQGGTWNITNLATLGSQNANSFIPSVERNTADNLRRNINVT